MSRNAPLGKKELNERFYSAVDPEAAFVTEVQVGFHQVAAARLVARHAAGLGKQRLRILELGASACLFAIAFVEVMARLALLGDASVDSLDYTAVELSRGALEAGVRGAARHGFEQLAPAAGAAAAEVASLRRPGAVEAGLTLVESDANRFVDELEEPYDVVILNELLDDLPCRVFYSDTEGVAHELAPLAEPDGACWKVELTESDAAPDEVPVSSLRRHRVRTLPGGLRPPQRSRPSSGVRCVRRRPGSASHGSTSSCQCTSQIHADWTALSTRGAATR